MRPSGCAMTDCPDARHAMPAASHCGCAGPWRPDQAAKARNCVANPSDWSRLRDPLGDESREALCKSPDPRRLFAHAAIAVLIGPDRP